MNKYGNYTKYMFLTVHGLTQPDSGYFMIETEGYSRLGGKTKQTEHNLHMSQRFRKKPENQEKTDNHKAKEFRMTSCET